MAQALQAVGVGKGRRRRFFGLGGAHGYLGWAEDEEFGPDCIDRPAKYAVGVDDSPYVGEYRATILKKYKGQEDYEEVGSFTGSWPEPELEADDPDPLEEELVEEELTDDSWEIMADQEAEFQLDDAWQFDETCDEATIERKKYGQVPFDGLAGRRRPLRLRLGAQVRLRRDDEDLDENNEVRAIPVGSVGRVFAVGDGYYEVAFSNGGWLRFEAEERGKVFDVVDEGPGQAVFDGLAGRRRRPPTPRLRVGARVVAARTALIVDDDGHVVEVAAGTPGVVTSVGTAGYVVDFGGGRDSLFYARGVGRAIEVIDNPQQAQFEGRGLGTYKGLVIRACVPARGRVVELRQTARGQVCVVEKTRRGEQPIACVAGVAAATSLFKAACRG